MTASGRGKIVRTVLESAGGAALAYAVNQFGTRNIAGDWTRRSVQAGIAVLGSAMLSRMTGARSDMGAAFAGAMMYPLIADLSLMLGVTGAADYGLGADLGADMDAQLGDMEEFYLDGDPTSAGLELW